ncbi:MAG TPA: ATP-binding protein [Desulfomonilaceae bacterium]|nr:ATP-binding protein [Desulfomonilaceae bacterium]
MPRRPKLPWNVYPSHLLVFIFALVAMVWYSSGILANLCNTRLVDALKNEALIAEKLLAPRISAGTAADVDTLLKEIGHRISGRITVSLPSGQIVGDSHEDILKIGNYARRPEIIEAFEGKLGVNARYSFISGEKMLYVAVPVIHNDRVIAAIRTAIPQPPLGTVLRSIYREILVGGLIFFLLAAALSYLISYKINRPIVQLKQGAARFAKGDLHYRLEVPDSEEFGELARAMNQMASQLNERLNLITKQRNELEAVLSGMMEAVVVVDEEKRVLQINDAAEELFGIDRERVKGRSVQESIRNTDFHRFVSRILGGEEWLEGDIVFMGEPEKFLQAHGSILRDEQSKGIGALVVLNDVTRLKTLENIRRDFVANVSHELKTPITSIKGFLETLREGAIRDTETAERFLEIILKHTDRLNSIIEDLLSLSRIERDTEKGEVPLQAGSVNDVLDAVIRDCSKKAEAKSIELVCRCSDSITANINSVLLEQAILNLVDNAIKYSDPGKTVTIEALSTPRETVIKVGDQGCGIPKEHLNRIFERFYRVDKARSRKIGGTGLGLSIVRHIINAHNGKITVESSPGKGSVFSIFLPTENNRSA